MHSISDWGKIENAMSLLVSTMEWSFPGANKGNSVIRHFPKPVSILVFFYRV